MDALIISAFSGAAMGAAITLAGNFWLNGKNFKNEYYKKVIDKRIKAYENVENLIFLMEASREYNDKEALDCFMNDTNISNFEKAYEKVISSKEWLSDELRQCLGELEAIRLSALYKITGLDNIDKEFGKFLEKGENRYIKESAEYSEKLIECRNQMTHTVTNDWLELYKVEDFLKKK